MAGLLFIHGGADAARALYDREQRIAWGQALPVVLEKHGFVSVEEAGPELLSEPRRLAAFDVVLVDRLEEGVWREFDPEAAAAAGAQLLVEGPAPAALVDWLGVEASASVDGQGGIVAVDPGLRAMANRYGVALGAGLSPPVVTEQSPPATGDGRSTQALEIDARLELAWRRRAWDVQRWRADPDATVLCEWVSLGDPADRFPAIVRRHGLTGCAFGLFAFLGQRHTSDPYEAGERRATNRSAGLESILLGLLDQLHARRGAVRARVLPWPRAARWARTIRHDLDADLGARRAGRILAAHDRAATAATFYSPAAADGPGLRAVAAAGRHEVAPASVGPRGALTLLWASAQGLAHAESVEHAHYLPHRFVAAEADGTLQTHDLLCLPKAEIVHLVRRFDRDALAALERRWRAAQGLLILAVPLGRPAALDRLLDRVLQTDAAADALHLTAAEATDWWRRTHVRGALRIRALGDGAFEVSAEEPLAAVALELLHPDGRAVVEVVDAGPEPLLVGGGVARSGLPRVWDDVTPHVTAVLGRRGGGDGDAAGAAGTLHNVGAAVPSRGEFLLDLVRGLTRRDLRGLRVLDVGCGYGTLAAYLAWRAGTARMLGVDRSPAMVEDARSIAAAAGLSDVVEFAVGDMTDLSGIEPASFDVVLANGVLMYARTGAELDACLAAAAAALAPGGHLVAYHRSRLSPRHPESGGRPLQLLPRALQPDRRAPGWKRWLSPMELRRRMRRAGFEQVRITGFRGSDRHDRWPRHLLGESYGIGGILRGGV